ncbi:uncharacterized protein LOC143916643 [Arctopsyche grandis]|uniref:uncharacterized protein LOC143916643 n=1 Tax=Arctopsyche grandis TaxID=121162 RepID=UPI00406D9C0F
MEPSGAAEACDSANPDSDDQLDVKPNIDQLEELPLQPKAATDTTNVDIRPSTETETANVKVEPATEIDIDFVAIVKNECEDKPPSKDLCEDKPPSKDVPPTEDKPNDDEPQPEEDTTTKRQRRNTRTITTPSKEFLRLSPEVESDPFGSDSDQDYQPPSSKTARPRLTTSTSKIPTLKCKPSPKRKSSPKRKPAKRPSNASSDTQPSSPSPQSVAFPAGSSRFLPIKIASVSSLSNPPLPMSNSKVKPKAMKNTIPKSQLPVAFSLLDGIGAKSSELGSLLHSKSEFFLSKNVKDASTKTTDNFIFCVKRIVQLLDLAQNNVQKTKDKFKKDVVQFLKDNKCEGLIESDSDLKEAVDSPNGVPNPPNLSSDKDPLKLSDPDSSDCEIIDEVVIPPNTYDALKKMERQGISWKNSKPPNVTNNLLNVMSATKQPIRLGKDVILKKVTAPPKTSNESFFCLDGRTLKPPDSFSFYGVFLFRDITQYVKQFNCMDWLDLHGEDATDCEVLNALKRSTEANLTIYTYKLMKRLDLVDLSSDIKQDDLFQNFKTFSSDYYNPLTLVDLCKKSIHKKTDNDKLVKCVKENTKISFVLIEKSQKYLKPKSLFMLSLNATLKYFAHSHECFTKREKRLHAKEICNLKWFQKQVVKINKLDYSTFDYFENHLKKTYHDIEINKYFDFCSSVVKKNENVNVSCNNQSIEPNLTEPNVSSGELGSDDSDDTDSDCDFMEAQAKIPQVSVSDSPIKLKSHNLLAKALMLDESSDSDASDESDDLEDREATEDKLKPKPKTTDGIVKEFPDYERNSPAVSNSDSFLTEVSSLLKDIDEVDVRNDQHSHKKRRLDFDAEKMHDDESTDSLPDCSRPEDVVSDAECVTTSSQNSDTLPVPLKRKRKNIRKVLDDSFLNEATKKAAKEEEERLKRLSQREGESGNVIISEGNETNEEFILDFDPATNEKISIHPDITKILKKHQIEGIKFIWDSCFETIKSVRENHVGSGCILAHCMGLGKTLQMIALIHSILTSEVLPIKTVLICCPLSTVLNWVDEFHKWLHEIKVAKKIQIYELSRFRKPFERALLLNQWKTHGGVFIVGYEMFRILANMTIDKKLAENFSSVLLNPGPDMVVCDEGHLLKNDSTSLAIAMNKILTRRRIVLTGTPLQNNLKEYYCMVNFVKPNLLGSHKEYTNRFINPITNGQHRDSSQQDINIMKKRSHVLHKMLQGSVQRKDASILYEFLPTKREFVLLIPLSTFQARLYESYLDKIKDITMSGKSLLKDYYIFQKIWTHPKLAVEMDNKYVNFRDVIKTDDVYDSLLASNKFIVLFQLLGECDRIGDKVILFSNSLLNLDIIEFYLKTQKAWNRGFQYYRMDGMFNMSMRRNMCNHFNSPKNTKIKLMMVSTRVGGLGINMIGANRVIIMDSSWNPSHDIQSIFRVFRFGQKKNCYIYRLVTQGTMEEKIYERSVTKEAIACRVVDEQQIDRHYSISELHKLYAFQHIPDTYQPTLRLPNDTVLANILHSVKSISQEGIPVVWSIHEHDSLLKDLHEEQLDETERREAWVEYEAEKLINDVRINMNTPPAPVDKSFNITKQLQPTGRTNSNVKYSNCQKKYDYSDTIKSTSVRKVVPSCSTIKSENLNGAQDELDVKNCWINISRHYKPYKSPIKRGAKSLVYNMSNVKRLPHSLTVYAKKHNDKRNLENIPIIDIDDNSCTMVDDIPLDVGSDGRKRLRRASSVLGSENDANIMDLTNLPDSPKTQRQQSKRLTGTPKKSTAKKVKSPIGNNNRSNTPKKSPRDYNRDHKRKRLNFGNSSTTVDSDVIILEPEVTKKSSEEVLTIELD